MLRNLLVLPDGSEVFSGAEGALCIENLRLTQSVNEGQELTLGSVCAAFLEAELITTGTVPALLPGQEVTLYKVDESGARHREGIFILEKPVRKSEHRLRITAYDRITLLDRDVSAWLASLTGWPYTLTQLGQMLCDLCGLQATGLDVFVGYQYVEKFTESAITGRQLMGYIAELCGRFVRCNADGVLELGWYAPSDITIAPTRKLPAVLQVAGEDVSLSHPDTVSFDDCRGNVALQTDGITATPADTDLELTALQDAQQRFTYRGSLEYEDYATTPITLVQARLAGGEYGYLYPQAQEDQECYILTHNPLLSGDPGDWAWLLQELQGLLKPVSYTPCCFTVPADLSLQPGSIVTVCDRTGKTFSCYVMQRVQEGQRDTLRCVGSLRRKNSNRGKKTDAQSAQQAVDALTQQKIFNKLTNNGEDQGIFLSDGRIYINADYIASGTVFAELVSAGILSSRDGKSFFLNLDNNILKGNFTELSIAGTPVEQIAQDAATGLTQRQIFDKLTDDGALPGLFMQDGQLYINANYLAAGVIRSQDGAIEIDLENGAQPIFNTGISTNGLTIRGDAYGAESVFSADVTEVENSHGDIVETMRVQMRSADGAAFGLINESFTDDGPVGGQLRLFDHDRARTANLYAGGSNAGLSLESGSDTAGVFLVNSSGTSLLQAGTVNCDTLNAENAILPTATVQNLHPLKILDRQVAWKSNGDGTYTLIGV